MKILVTGATGFVGRHLVPKLAEMHNVFVIVRDVEKAKKLYGTNVDIYYGDMNDTNSIISALKHIQHMDCVINTVGGGALSSNNNYYNDLYKLNVDTLKNLISALDTTNMSDNIKLFVHISSLAAMGALNSSDVYNEETVCDPVLPYEIVKYESERHLMNMHNHHKFKIVVFRPPQIYGTESKEIVSMIKLIKKGKFPKFSNRMGSLPLIHIEDFTDIIIHTISDNYKLEDGYNIYIVCGENHMYLDIVEMVKSIHHKGGYIEIPYSIAHIGIKTVEKLFHLFNRVEPINIYRLNSICRIRNVDDSKFRNTFGFKYKHNLQEVISHTD